MNKIIFLLLFIACACSSNSKKESGTFGWKEIAQFEYHYLEGETLSSFMLPLPASHHHARRAGFKYRYQVEPAGIVRCDSSMQNKIMTQDQDVIEPLFQNLFSEVECFIDKTNPNQIIKIKLQASTDLSSTDFYKLYATHFSHQDGKSKNERIKDFMTQLDEMSFTDLAYYLSIPIQSLKLSANTQKNVISIPKNRPGKYFLLINHIDYSNSLKPYTGASYGISANFNPNLKNGALQPKIECRQKDKVIFSSELYASHFSHEFSSKADCTLSINKTQPKEDSANLSFILISETDLKNLIESEMKNMDRLISKRLLEDENAFKNAITIKMNERIKNNSKRNMILESLNDVFEREIKLFIEKMGFGIHFTPMIRSERQNNVVKNFLTLKTDLYQLQRVNEVTTSIPLQWDGLNLYTNIEITNKKSLAQYNKVVFWNQKTALEFFKKTILRSELTSDQVEKLFVSTTLDIIKSDLALKLVYGGKCFERESASTEAKAKLFYGGYGLFAANDSGFAGSFPKVTSPYFHLKKVEPKLQTTIENQHASEVCWPVNLDDLVE